jgi:TolB-like protein
LATVFLSYAREDSSHVRPLVSALDRSGHIVWWDEHVPGGEQFTQAIQEALDKAEAVVVVWSKTSVQSAWVRDEAAYARDSGRLVPVTLDGTLPPLGFREYQSIDLSSWKGRPASRALEPLKSAISAKCGQAEPTDAPAQSTVGPSSKRRWALAALGAVILAVLGLAASGVIETPLTSHTEAETPSIAVLPFADLSPTHDKAYFAEGVAEEILSALGTEKGIKVLGRTSARQIDRGADPKELHRKLGVTHLLEGSARSAGDQLRVNVRLIDTSDGRSVWEEEYRGRLADVFAVQDRIAAAVVQRLRGTLSRRLIRSAVPTGPENYELYLAARALMRNRTQKGLQEAFTLAKEVVRRDPNYAPGHALLAELYQLLSDDFRAYGTMPLAEARKLGIVQAKEAIRLAPGIADGYAALGIHLTGTDSLAPLKRAIELDQSRGEFRTWLGFSLNDIGRHDEALAQYRAAVEIDPLGFAPVNRYVHALAAAGQPDQAMNVIRQFVARGGDPLLQPTFMMQVATAQADPSGAIGHGRMMLRNERVRHQYFRLFVAAPLQALGKGKEAASVLLPMQDLHAAYYRGDQQLLRRNIAAHGAGLWSRADGGFAFVHLANLRDWDALTWLYDQRGMDLATFCDIRPNDGIPFVLALRARNRTGEANQLLSCFRDRLARELHNTARLPQDWPGDLEFRRASYSAVTGDSGGTLQWLAKAADHGWLGQPYSSRLTDYPQFDVLRRDRRFAALQRQVDSRIARERAEAEAQERRRS